MIAVPPYSAQNPDREGGDTARPRYDSGSFSTERNLPPGAGRQGVQSRESSRLCRGRVSLVFEATAALRIPLAHARGSVLKCGHQSRDDSRLGGLRALLRAEGAPRAHYATSCSTTLPETSVSRKSRP